MGNLIPFKKGGEKGRVMLAAHMTRSASWSPTLTKRFPAGMRLAAWTPGRASYHQVVFENGVTGTVGVEDRQGQV